MDCQRCETLLLDLAYGELPAAQEAEARVHLSRCAQCSSALERISGGLAFARQMPLEQAPPSLSEAVMRAAVAQAHSAPSAPKPSLFEQLGDLLRRLAMARQVQMATVMLLIMVIGLWSVPELSRRREAQGGTVVGPDDDGEAGPSAALAPAERLDLAVDRRTGRIRAKGDLAEPAQPRTEGDKSGLAADAPHDLAMANLEKKVSEPVTVVPAAPSPEGASAKEAEASAPGEHSDDAVALARDQGKAELDEGELAFHEFAPAPPASAAVAQSASGDGTAARKAGPASNAALDSMARSERAGALGGLDALGDSVGAGAATSGAGIGTATPMRARGSTTVMEAKAKTAVQTPSTKYALALERYRSGDYRSARESFSGLLTTGDAAQRAGTLLYLARSERALGRCDLAVGHYEQLIVRNPATSEATQALPEAVGCYEQLGQPARAKDLLQRAARLPALAARARSLQQRSTPATSAPAKPAAAPAEPFPNAYR